MPQLDLFYFFNNSLYLVIFLLLLCYISFFNIFPIKILKSFLSIFIIKNIKKRSKFQSLYTNIIELFYKKKDIKVYYYLLIEVVTVKL